MGGYPSSSSSEDEGENETVFSLTDEQKEFVDSIEKLLEKGELIIGLKNGEWHHKIIWEEIKDILPAIHMELLLRNTSNIGYISWGSRMVDGITIIDNLIVNLKK